MAYKYKFLARPDDSLKCMVCLEVAKDPKQHGECGKLFCGECLDKNGNKPCPNCRAGNPHYFPDGKSQREIKAIRVRCDLVDRGCDWDGTVGTLVDHVTKCGFTLVSCPNKCKVEGEHLKLMKNDLDNHLKNICPNRDYVCEHCGEKGTYASMTEEHDSVCIKKVVSCPNTECTSTMELGLTEKHVQTVCNYTVVACKYASIGCSVKEMRMDVKQHEKDDRSHLPMALEKIMKLESKIVKLENTTSSLEDTISSLEDTISSLEDTTSSQMTTISSLEDTTSSQIDAISSLEYTTSMLKKNLDTLNREKLITFNLPGYSSNKEDDVRFYSESFYTSPGGYKMRIEVDPNGCGDDKGTHMSVYSQLLEGPDDANLSWPFLGTVTVELLNQLADNNHHCMKLAYETIDNAQVGSAWGFPKFLPYTELAHDQASNTQYLMEDTLYFRVTVKVDHHKPWLHCTLPTLQKTSRPIKLISKATRKF